MSNAKDDRREEIAQLVNREGQIDFARLKLKFPDASEMTLRQDLKWLDEAGKIVRIHGGAKSIDSIVRTDDLFFKKATRNVEQKRQIARKAIRFLKPGMSIFIDCGTTLTEFAKLIPDEQFFIVTNSISCMPELARLSKPEVKLLGGSLNRVNLSTKDSRNSKDIEKMNFNICFLAVTGYSEECGFSCGTEADDDLRYAAIRRAEKVIALMDSSKIGRVFPVTYATLDDIDAIVLDDGADPAVVEGFRSKGKEVY